LEGTSYPRQFDFQEAVLSLLSVWDEYFDQLAQSGRYILVEKQTYRSGRPKPDLITIKEADGLDLVCLTERGYCSGRLQLPAEVFSHFLRNELLYQDASEGGNGNWSIFRLTSDALSIAQELGWRPISSLNVLDVELLACGRVLGEVA
jgi:hypothetical protein